MLISVLIVIISTVIPILILIRYPICISMPTSRGLHENPIPTSGGLAILISYISITFYAFLSHSHSIDLYSPIFPIISASLLGLLDDKYSLSKVIRFIFQIIISIWIVSMNPETSLYMKILWAIFIVYFINIFNFMDGINALATTQTLFILLCITILDDFYSYNAIILFALPLIIFLVFNSSPARIFLGNSGSYLLATLIMILLYSSNSSVNENLLNHTVIILIILTVMICDTTYTLISRFISKYFNDDKSFIDSVIFITNPHRTHNYQIMTQKYHSHSKVNIMIFMYNIIWCFPLAWLSQEYVNISVIFLLLSYLPYIILCIVNKAGKHV